jgi:WD40 repeat protein
MIPLLLPIHGDDCSGPQTGEYSAGIDAVTEQQKQPMILNVREMLQSASSPPEEASEWNLSPSSVLNEGVLPSALRSRLLQLDSNPSMVQGTPSETSSRDSGSIGRHEGDHEPHAYLSHAQLLLNYNNSQHLSIEDAMDVSEEVDYPTHIDGYSAAQRLASSIPPWETERPCRPNPNSNHDMSLFLSAWRVEYEFGNVTSPISNGVMNIREQPRSLIISSLDVAEARCDMQGINWAGYGTNMSEVKSIRSRYHQHPHIRQYPSDRQARRLPDREPTFRFQQTNTQAQPWIEHYQLRNQVATTSYNDTHYVSKSKVMSISLLNPQPYCVMDLDMSSDPFHVASDFHITALAAAGSALIAGGFHGEFAVQDLMSEYGTEPVTGRVSNHPHAITNHIHTFHSRINGSLLAAFCSNDKYLRTLDINTSRILSNIPYDDVMNCSATSPNGRLRALVGDFEGALIVDADSGRILEQANGGSRGHGFACAWADNDIHVATAGQDCQVLVWDARNWAAPLAVIATENTYATSLQFSPVGGGSPALIIAEAADAVSVVDALTYASKQTIDLFGDVAGTAISADGSQLTIAAGDRHLGGLMTFQRRDFGAADTIGSGSRRSRRRISSQRSDWLQECELETHPRVRLHAKARRRRGLDLEFF